MKDACRQFKRKLSRGVAEDADEELTMEAPPVFYRFIKGRFEAPEMIERYTATVKIHTMTSVVPLPLHTNQRSTSTQHRDALTCMLSSIQESVQDTSQRSEQNPEERETRHTCVSSRYLQVVRMVTTY